MVDDDPETALNLVDIFVRVETARMALADIHKVIRARQLTADQLGGDISFMLGQASGILDTVNAAIKRDLMAARGQAAD